MNPEERGHDRDQADDPEHAPQHADPERAPPGLRIPGEASLLGRQRHLDDQPWEGHHESAPQQQDRSDDQLESEPIRATVPVSAAAVLVQLLKRNSGPRSGRYRGDQ